MSVREGNLRFITRLAVYMVALSAVFIGFGMIQPILSIYTSGFVGSSYLLVGFLISMIGLFKAGMGPISGLLSDTYGKQKIAYFGAGLIASSMAIVYFSGSVTMLSIGFLLYGVGQAMFFLSMMTTMIDIAGQERRALTMGLYEGGNGFSIMIGSALSSTLVKVIGISGVFGVASVLSLVSFLVCLLLIKETPPKNNIKVSLLNFHGIKALLRPEYIVAMYTAFFFMYSQSIFSAIIPLYTIQENLLRLEELTFIFVAFSGATSLGSILAGPVSDSIGRKWPIVLGMSCTAFCFVGLYSADAPITLIIACLGLGFGTGFFHPVASALVGDISTSENRGKAFGFYRLARDLGTFVGPAVAGLISALLGVGSLFLFNTSLAVLGLFLAIFVVKDH